MNINDITYDINEQYEESDLPLVVDTVDTLEGVTIEQVEDFCEKSGLDIEHIYRSKDFSTPYFYFKFPLYLPLYVLEATDGADFLLKNVKETKEYTLKAYNEKDWLRYMMITKGHCSLLIFKEIYPLFSDGEKYTYLREFYIRLYHGHKGITQDMWEDAVSKRASDYVVELPYDAPEYKVYRGAGSRSASATESMSWSLSTSVAASFAGRDSNEPIIYEATVKKEDVIDYIDGSEQEIIVFPEFVTNLIVHEQEGPIALLKTFIDGEYIQLFSFYKQIFSTFYFLNDSPDHSELHSKRVLFNALALSYLEDLTPEECGILAMASLYHDIGRTNDEEDEEHGKVSKEQLEAQKGYLAYAFVDDFEEVTTNVFSNEEADIINRIIENHSLPDEVGLSDERMEGLTSKGKESYIKLYKLFKDADALDRLRFNDLDMKYLRTSSSKKLISLAFMSLREIK